MTKVNVDQFVLGSRKKELMWNLRRRHPLAYALNRLQWYLYPKLNHVSAFPVHVDFETSSLCNMRCPMCFRPHRADKNDGNMDFDLYCKAIDECVRHNLYSIRLSWRGEPTMNPKFIEMVRYAKQAGIKEVSALSNGLLLEGDYARQLVEAGIDYLSLSIDGLYEEYDRIRKPAKFQETVERIRQLRKLRKSHGNGFPRIKVNTIWSQVQDRAEEYYDIFDPLADIISFNPDYDYSEEACAVPASHCCQYPFQRLSVKWNGDVPMCISDWDSEFVLGNIKECSLQSIWQGETLQQIRNDHMSGGVQKYVPCRKCHRPVTTQVGNKRV